MNHVIIGAGPAAIAAVEAIRATGGPGQRICLVSDEPAYARMLLPDCVAGDVASEHVFVPDRAHLENLDVRPFLGRRALRVLAAERAVLLDDGQLLTFDRLLVASGSSPVRPPIPGGELAGVHTFWTLEDCRRIIARLDSGHRVVIVGGGFLGLTVLNALSRRGARLSLVEMSDRLLPRMLDARAAGLAARWLEAHGVDVDTADRAVRFSVASDGSVVVQLASGTRRTADLVVLATGSRPNVSFLEGTGVHVEQGVVVDDHMRTSLAGIFAAGDAAEGPVVGGGRAVHPMQQTAVEHGRVAGANMAGADVAYRGSLQVDVLDVCGLSCARLGASGGEDEEVTVVTDPDRELYRKIVWDGDRIVGAEFVGPRSDVALANDLRMVKAIIESRVKFGAVKQELLARPLDIDKAYTRLGVAAQVESSAEK